jgi:hypothetical protein
MNTCKGFEKAANSKVKNNFFRLKPKKLCETLNLFQTLEKETQLKRNAVDATRILEITSEHIKQYRDKNQCLQFKQEFQNSCLKVDEYIKQISLQIDEREQLTKLLEQSEIFYDAQYKDAKLVVNVSVRAAMDRLVKL